MKMSTPTSLWCYCSYALKWNAGKVYSLEKDPIKRRKVVTAKTLTPLWYDSISFLIMKKYKQDELNFVYSFLNETKITFFY